MNLYHFMNVDFARCLQPVTLSFTATQATILRHQCLHIVYSLLYFPVCILAIHNILVAPFLKHMLFFFMKFEHLMDLDTNSHLQSLVSNKQNMPHETNFLQNLGIS